MHARAKIERINASTAQQRRLAAEEVSSLKERLQAALDQGSAQSEACRQATEQAATLRQAHEKLHSEKRELIATTAAAIERSNQATSRCAVLQQQVDTALADGEQLQLHLAQQKLNEDAGSQQQAATTRELEGERVLVQQLRQEIELAHAQQRRDTEARDAAEAACRC